MEKVFCMIDTETTGLKKHHEIIEIAAVLFESNFEIRAEHCLQVNAEHAPETFSTEAMKINGFDPAKIANHGLFSDEAGKNIKAWLNFYTCIEAGRIVPVGHNILNFDIPKIKNFILPDFDNYFSVRQAIDTKVVANFFNIRGEFESTSLIKLAEFFNIPTTGAHRALNDCYRNLEVLKHLYAGRIG